MLKKILLVLAVLFALVAAFIYQEWTDLSKDPEFVILNKSGSVVSIEAKWRDSKAIIENLRNGGSFTFSIREEASMKLNIHRPESEMEQVVIGYFSSGNSFTIEVGQLKTNIKVI